MNWDMLIYTFLITYSVIITLLFLKKNKQAK